MKKIILLAFLALSYKFGSAEPVEVFRVVESMPEFRGGEGQLYTYLNNSIKYPQEAQQKGIEGTVRVKFIVNENGSITHAKATNNTIGYGLEQEAIRAISEMPRWKPGRNNGIPIKVYYQVCFAKRFNKK
jgi:protein TonB